MISRRLLPWFVLIFSSLSICLSAGAGATTILVLGDSISAAYGVPAGSGWVDLLRAELEREQKCCTVVNASISGETTEGGKYRLPGLLRDHAPQAVIIELGGNDGLRGFPLEVTRANLLAMVEAARDAGASVLLLGMRIPPNYGPRYTEAFHRLYAEIAGAADTAIVPFMLEGIATRPELMQTDGIHPTADAQPLILANVLPAVLELLRARDTNGPPDE
jgi:acyl-CoA thioesterase-1